MGSPSCSVYLARPSTFDIILQKMRSLILFALLALTIVLTSSAAVDDYNEEMSDDEARYLTDLSNYLEGAGRLEKSKRGRFCLSRDMTCRKTKNGRDMCCRGSQCACNIFGQNCRCSSIGLFRRLGRR